MLPRQHAPEQAHLAARFLVGRERDDGRARAIFRNEARRAIPFGENGDRFHVQFFGGVTDGFGDGFADVKFAGARWGGERP